MTPSCLQTNNNTQDSSPPTTSRDTVKADPDPPQLVPLPGPWRAPQDWAEAAEFVPGLQKPRSWAQVVNTGVTYPGMEMSCSQAESLICPYFKVGECRYGDSCAYIHGETCDYCGQNSLHPTHLDQRRHHLADCLQEHEHNMELSFAVARSREKTCGICMEVVLDKPKGEARLADRIQKTATIINQFLVTGLEFYRRATTASVCPASESGGRPNSSSIR